MGLSTLFNKMMKYYIFDLDNTLYDYDVCNEYAYNATCDLKNISEQYKTLLPFSTSSHNRNLYFKKYIEEDETHEYGLKDLKFLNEKYWSAFYSKMKPFKHLISFLETLKQNKVKIGILTDFEAEYQIEKLKKLDLLKYVDCIVSSEEVGYEKPHKLMFYEITKRLDKNGRAHV